MLSDLVDHAAFAISRALYPRASRHLCKLGYHSPELVDTSQVADATYMMVACDRPSCTWTETGPLVSL